jgi:hypothetical protein
MKGARIFLISAAVAVAAAAPAGAYTGTNGATSPRMAFLKARGHLAIQRRLNELDRLSALTHSATHLKGADRAALLSKLSSDRSGLQSLDKKIQSDTDATTLHNDLQSIVNAYRIYVLVAPQVHLTVAADRIGAFIEYGDSVVGRLLSAIDKAKAKGKDVKAAQAAVNDLKTELSDAATEVAGIPSKVIALTPSGYPGNRTTLLSARSSILTARAHLVKARADAQAAIGALA